jgi:lysophospholipase L1-like esterase
MDKTYCIFGDSVAQASYVATSWVELFRRFLEEKYPNDFINVFNLGIGGNTTNDLLTRFTNECLVRGPTSLIFQIGVNDSGYFRKLPNYIVSEENFKSNLNSLIKEAKKFSKDIAFLGLVLGDDSILRPLPESSTGKSYIKPRVDKYDSIIKEIVEKEGCKYIYLLDKLAFADFQDGLHPNDQGHGKIFKEIKKFF